MDSHDDDGYSPQGATYGSGPPGRSVEETFAQMIEGRSPPGIAGGGGGGGGAPTGPGSSYGGYPVPGYPGRKPGITGSNMFDMNDLDDMNVEREEHLFQQMFSAAFTFCCFTLFAYPFVSSVYLGSQENIQFWVGHVGQLGFFVPVIFLVCYMAQVRFAAPKRILLILSTLIPALLLLIIGNMHHSRAYQVADQLLSTDCTTFTSKRELDRAWFMAHAFYIDCLQKLSNGPLLKLEDAMKVYRIHHCEGYEDAYAQYNSEWGYLAYVEENHLCSGWCQIGPRLWSFRDAKDSCSIAVGDIFKGEVQRTSLQIMVVAVLALVLSMVGILVGPTIMRKTMSRS